MRDTITSPRVQDIKRKRRLYRTRLFVLSTLLVVITTGALAYFSSHSRVVLSTVRVTGTRIINASDIESFAKENMSGSYLHAFAKSNAFIYPRKKIYNDLLNRFHRIETLSVYRDNLNTLRIDITERSGSYLYCGMDIPEIDTDIGENCYFVNDEGYIFDKAPYFSGNIYFKYYASLLDGDPNSPLGKKISSPESFHTLTQFIESIKSLQFDPLYVVIKQEGTSTLYLSHRRDATAPMILFKNNDMMFTMLKNLNASMNQKEFASEIENKYDSLLYIDLRFNNKVVYKFK